MRAKKQKLSDECIRKHVGILEKLAAANGGYIPKHTWLEKHGYWTSYEVFRQYPAAFAHLKYESEKKYEIYQAHNTLKSGTPEILPPAKKNILAPANYKTISEYEVPGGRFSPTELRINAGLDEKEWLAVGRAISHVQQSCFFWVGDWCLYGFRLYGKKVTGDLAQQATGYSRAMLRICIRVARRFPPERRRAEITFWHHLTLSGFAPELADQLLEEACAYGYTAKQIRELADEATGKKKKAKPGNKLVIYLPDYMYGELKQRACTPLHHFVPQVIIAEWLERKRKEEKV